MGSQSPFLPLTEMPGERKLSDEAAARIREVLTTNCQILKLQEENRHLREGQARLDTQPQLLKSMLEDVAERHVDTSFAGTV